MECPKCKSKNVKVIRLFYHCQDCGQIDDLTLDMITSSKNFKINKEAEENGRNKKV